MKHLLNPRVRDIRISGIRTFFNRVAQYPDAVSLTIGQPDFATPDHIKEAGKRAIDENRTTYTPNAGLLALREAASAFMEEKYGLTYDPATEVITTNGASEAIDIVLRTILTEGCEVILPAPVYPGYEPIIRLCGATPVYVDTTDSDFKMTADKIAQKLTVNTRCVILPYPSNPTGCTLDEQALTEIAELLADQDVFVLSDEIYSELIYEGTHRSLASYPALHEKTIVINGLSKSHSMTGWRIGFTFAPAYISEQMLKVHQYNATCASSISQYAALDALTEGRNDADIMKEEYDKRRRYVCERLTQMGLAPVVPTAAFYVFPSIQEFGLPSFEFASRLLEEKRVAAVPGDAFSTYGEGYIRISYAYALEVLEEGLNRLEAFVNELRNQI
ncbi:aminotransferase [Aneurinibacillus soli]|uniref:Aminotransferase n=1 Tax=Aneurinibacillus soli TaxID=1500254 RepID=A0A0U5B850_9BACL|nr:aminotransferase A [Aneurinibacillus soli]PYE59131.1 aminotransferase [Aneurinibacillus soli]BAU29551.1 putative N-acetyl-LL-diaminopimelate aminotransferase [Aneurinibacillus soli]